MPDTEVFAKPADFQRAERENGPARWTPGQQLGMAAQISETR